MLHWHRSPAATPNLSDLDFNLFFNLDFLLLFVRKAGWGSVPDRVTPKTNREVRASHLGADTNELAKRVAGS